MQAGTENALRTRVYIDGYNLYYGCLKNSPHKWLDVHRLIEQILPSVHYELNGQLVSYVLEAPAIKYFTALILPAFGKSDDSVACQQHYHDALQGHHGASLEIIKGYHDAKPARAYRHEPGKAARDSEMIDIWKLEEKQSDVKLALNAYSDAMRSEVDQVIAVTNDSDFAPAMEHIRRHTNVILGLIVPRPEKTSQVNAQLSEKAHWVRTSIRDEEFAQSQLPSMIRLSKNSVVHKPVSWYPRPDLLGPVLEEAMRVKRSVGSARKWLNQPCEHLSGRVPISMCNSEAEHAELWTYMQGYTKRFLR